MKKTIFLLSTLILLLAACTPKEKTAYTITGTNVPTHLNGDTIYLRIVDSTYSRSFVIDSVIVSNGKFTIKGEKAYSTIGAVEVKNFQEKRPITIPIRFVLEPGNITISFDSVPSVSGTALNEEYNSIREVTKLNIFKYSDEPEKQGQFFADLKVHYETKRPEIMTFIKANINTQVGIFTFLVDDFGLTDEDRLELISLMPKATQDIEEISSIKKDAIAQQATPVGSKFIDLKAKTMDGKDLALSEIVAKNKYTLVDFWASWCAPCIGEIPHLKKTYAEYKDKGFEIFGVSLDEDLDEWAKATKAHKVVWPQIVDPKGWGDLANVYGVQNIPHTVLIDQEGTIIAKGLRGDALTNKLKELLK